MEWKAFGQSENCILTPSPTQPNALHVQFNSVPWASQAGWIPESSLAAWGHCWCKKHWKDKFTCQSYHSSMLCMCVCVANSRLTVTFPRIHYCCRQNCRLVCHGGRTASKKRFRNLKDHLTAIGEMAFAPHVQATSSRIDISHQGANLGGLGLFNGGALRVNYNLDYYFPSAIRRRLCVNLVWFISVTQKNLGLFISSLHFLRTNQNIWAQNIGQDIR